MPKAETSGAVIMGAKFGWMNGLVRKRSEWTGTHGGVET